MEITLKFGSSPTDYALFVTKGIEKGLKIIIANKYVLIRYTDNGDFVDVFDSLEELLKKIGEYCGDDIRQALQDIINEI